MEINFGALDLNYQSSSRKSGLSSYNKLEMETYHTQ